MKGLLLRLSGFVVICILCILLALFALEMITTDSDYTVLSASNAALAEDSFSVQLSMDTALRLFKGYRYQVEADALYITVYSGSFYTSFRCREGPLTLRIEDAALAGVEQVYLRNGTSVKRIYPE